MGERIECLKCGKMMTSHVATERKPYHFDDSGLSDVYLVGVTYFKCSCGHTVVQLPALTQLLNVIARDLVKKPSSLNGEELRYLRKRLGKKASDFAREIGVEPETLSRIENDKQAAGETTDKLIRLYYILTSSDSVLRDSMLGKASELFSSWTSIKSPTKIVATTTSKGWRAVAA